MAEHHHMKVRFYFLTFLLLLARGCDFYSTSLWIFDHPSHETNPLNRIFEFGWRELIVSNLIIVGLIIYGFYFYTFRYSRPKFAAPAHKLGDFISELYFNQKGVLYQILYRMPIKKNIAWTFGIHSYPGNHRCQLFGDYP